MTAAPTTSASPMMPNAAVIEGAAPGSAENVCLPNDTKIRFCNAFDAIKAHCILCKECDMYLRWGDGDLCSAGKTIIAMELCFTDTSIAFPPNAGTQRPGDAEATNATRATPPGSLK